ncbi:amino acid transporter [Coniophora puteana RWD-64-598 SS2]|uniref:Amino acid transporter n=1 Tax=Coniophora puteana (strain RWD-64-598) TaxID=741705 RepID=A0A5M3MH96_CONPW|nr:amino acid transporter [Coniophora puteana RWD-64-598 SS2]EIW78154.1 amino acid transporter [Coniophora puteana RWD-64-598 SS2]
MAPRLLGQKAAPQAAGSHGGASSSSERTPLLSNSTTTGVDEGARSEAPLAEAPDSSDDAELNPGELAFDEDTAGGLGRHLGVTSCTLLIVGRIIGTGIFSTPSSILGGVGSVGASLTLWVLGFSLSFCGLFIWLELGTMIPRSGGSKVYLEAVYTRPKYLTTMVFATHAIILGFTASGCIIFASNILVATGHEASRWVERGIALTVMIFVTLLHGLAPRSGIALMNGLSVFKIFILLFVVVTGFAVLSGKTRVSDPYANFRQPFSGSSHSANDYATASFKVLNAFAGWSNVNSVLNNVRNPVRTLKISGPLGLGICAVLYLFANIAYFSAATKEEINNSGVTVAALFFGKVFGEAAQRALAVLVALSALGNVITVTFTTSRINQELAKEGVPLPFGNKFWASNWPTGKSPFPGLIIHLVPSVIVILGPPPKTVYPFILDVEGYPGQIFNFFIVIGLFWLRWTKPNVHRPFKVWLPLAVFYLAAAVFLLIAPFIRPPNGVGDTPPLPYYLYALVGIGVLLAGVLYWAVWRIVLPRIFGYALEPRKERLDDGTVVTVFDRKKIA